MSNTSRVEKACAGLGLSAGAAGIATMSGAASAVGGGMLATGITNCVAAAPGIAKVAILGGQVIATAPALVSLAPFAIAGGIIYAGYNAIRYAMEK